MNFEKKFGFRIFEQSDGVVWWTSYPWTYHVSSLGGGEIFSEIKHAMWAGL